jgi:RNA polymerase sigma-70 factor (ECF subfamily)
LAPNAAADVGPYADRSDEWLVERCRETADATSDKAAAFEELVRRYRSPVFRLAVSILGQEFVPEAEDVAQDVMLRVHRSLDTFRGDAKVGSWIYRITFNHALNVKERMRFTAPHIDDRVLADTPSAVRAPDAQFEESRRQQALMACVEQLPDIYQSALRLHYWLGASMAEIAEMLDTPENTVKSYLHRARKLLHAMLKERGLHE